jgi:hypothetical protein
MVGWLNWFCRQIDNYTKKKPRSPISIFFLWIKTLSPRQFDTLIAILVSVSFALEIRYLLDRILSLF